MKPSRRDRRKRRLVPRAGTAESIVVALDWTDFDKDDHTTLCAYMVTTHGRAMPLAWKTVKKSELAERRSQLEEDLIVAVHEWIPKSVRVTLLADRGFGNQVPYTTLELLGWDYIIRFRGCILVEFRGVQKTGERLAHADGARHEADGCEGDGRSDSARRRRRGEGEGHERSVVPRHLPARLDQVGDHQALRPKISIEETFRDTKDLHFLDLR